MCGGGGWVGGVNGDWRATGPEIEQFLKVLSGFIDGVCL